MNRTISDDYLAQNAALHEKPGYGSSGHLWLGHVLELADAMGASSVIDYGAGKGTLGPYLERYGLTYTPYDPVTFPKKPTNPADLVVCLDVLEHVEPKLLDRVLAELSALTGGLFFCVVSTRPSSKTLTDGRNAHLIVEPWDWWKERLHSAGLWKGIRTRQHPDHFDFVGRALPPRGVSEQIVKRIKGQA